jgi:sugar lactone lactonase YvrE
VAGTGAAGYSGDEGGATSAQLNLPRGVAADGSGNLLIADQLNHCIRRVDLATGGITTVAGIGVRGSSGDGGAATSASLTGPRGVAVDPLGNLFIADMGNDRVRRVDAASGIITTVAGGGAASGLGDGGPATSARLDLPPDVAVDGRGNFFVADAGNYRIRRVDAETGIITTLAGTGALAFIGDGGAATSAGLSSPRGITVDSLGRLFISDNFNRRIRRVDLNGSITTVAGTGQEGGSGDDGPATSAQFSHPRGVAVDSLGNLFIADAFNHRIRRVDASGIITTVAGTGEADPSGDGGPATSAGLQFPNSVALDHQGNLFIADDGNRRVRKVDAETGVISTVAGTGESGFSGDGGPATSAQLGALRGVALDGQGNLFIADGENHRIRRVDADTGVITTLAGTGEAGFSGDGDAATSAQLSSPHGVVVDGLGNLFFVDQGNFRIRRVGSDGVISTVAGTGEAGFSGDGGTATDARFSSPYDIAADGLGTLLIADGGNDCVRRLDAVTGAITTVAGRIDPEGMGPIGQAMLADPRTVVPGAPLSVFAGGASGTVQVLRHDVGWLEVVAGRYPQPEAIADRARFRNASFGSVGGVAFDASAGLIYLTESTANRIHVVTIVDPDDKHTWTIATLANEEGTAGFANGSAATARFRNPTGLFLDEAAQVLYVADTGNHVLRAIDVSGGTASATVSTVAGTAETLGFFGDYGPATAGLMYQPQAVTRCANGDLFVADTGNHRVRRIEPNGTITTVLGDGTAASSGQGAPASTFPVNAPLGLACDPFGNLLVTSTSTVRLVAADDAGVVDGTGVALTVYGASPRDTFPASVTRCLTGLAVVDAATVQVTDTCTGILVELRREAAP